MGSNLTTMLLTGFSVAGMYSMNDRNTVNSIELVKDGDNKGMLKFSISTSPFTSDDVYAKINDCQGVFCINGDDVGEEDLDS